jgi:hypothetical protein
VTNRAHRSKLRRFSGPVARAAANPGVIVPIHGSNATSLIVDDPVPGETVGGYMGRLGWEAISDRYGKTIAYAVVPAPRPPLIEVIRDRIDFMRRHPNLRELGAVGPFDFGGPFYDPGDDAA